VRLTKVGQLLQERAQNTLTKYMMTWKWRDGWGTDKRRLNGGIQRLGHVTTLPKRSKASGRLYPRVELRLLEVVTASNAPLLDEHWT